MSDESEDLQTTMNHQNTSQIPSLENTNLTTAGVNSGIEPARKETVGNSSKEAVKKKSKKRKRSISLSPEKRSMKRSKKSRKHRRRSPSTSSSSCSSSSSSSSDSEEEEVVRKKRYKITPKGEEHKWSLPLEMAVYANDHFKIYIPEKEIGEEVLTKNPVPSNLQDVLRLDDFAKNLLASQRSGGHLSADSQMERFQDKVHHVMGPLSRIWKGLEDIQNSTSEAVEVPVDDFVELIQQATLLLGQASLSITYTRRLNILKQILKDPRKAKSLLKEQSEVLQESDGHLFGKKFRTFILDSERLKKQSLEVFKNAAPKQPFRQSPHHEPNRPHGGGRYYYAGKQGNRDHQNNNGRFSNSRKSYGAASNGKYLFFKAKRGSFLQQYSRNGSTDVSKTCSPTTKRVIFRKTPKSSIGRKAFSVFRKLEKTDKRSRNIVSCTGLSNSICEYTFTEKNTIPNTNVKGSKVVSGQGNSRVVEERSHPQSKTSHPGRIFEQPLFSRQEGWGESTSNKFEKAKQICSLRTFQNGRFVLSEIPSTTRRFPDESRPQRCIFFGPISKGITKICEIPMVRQPLRISLPLFWLGPSTKSFYHSCFKSQFLETTRSKNPDFLKK